MFDQLKGPWDRESAERFLAGSTCPVRLGCHGADGFPRVVSLWYLYARETIHCVSHERSALVRMLRRDPRVGFEVAPDGPPYLGLRGRGEAQLQPLGDSPLLEELLQRYLGGSDSQLGRWLLSRSEQEVWVTLRPASLYSWDYRERMAGTAATL